MVLTHWDILLTPFYLLLAYFIGQYITFRKVRSHPEYRYFTAGLFAKLAGAVLLCMIYQFHYSGGDTTNYFSSARSILSIATDHPAAFFDIWLLDNRTPQHLSLFNSETGFPVYWHDAHSFAVVRIVLPLVFLGCFSYVPASVLMAGLSYSGIWMLYRLFCSHFPAIKKQLAIAFLFIPSVIFWGSGILKDSITLSAVGWYVYSFYYLFIGRRRLLKHLLFLVISATVILDVKPYILFALLPGSVIWLSSEWIARMRHKVIKFVAAPLLVIIAVSAGFLLLSNLEEQLGLYAIDNVLDRAVIVQRDLKQDYYEGNSFDIGEFDSTIPSILGKAPVAIFAALFRPTLFDVRNAVMLFSALENTFIILFTVLMLVRLKIFGFFTLIYRNPLLLFSMLFALFFAFSVGLSISNFGSLVRLKIPSIPFFVAGLFILRHLYYKKVAPRTGILSSFAPAAGRPQTKQSA